MKNSFDPDPKYKTRGRFVDPWSAVTDFVIAVLCILLMWVLVTYPMECWFGGACGK